MARTRQSGATQPNGKRTIITPLAVIIRAPIVIITSDPAQKDVITKTVWHCTKVGDPGIMVYTQKIAIAKLQEGYDIETGSVIHLPQNKYAPVEHDDGTVHAIDLAKLSDESPLWRNAPVCGMATECQATKPDPNPRGPNSASHAGNVSQSSDRTGAMPLMIIEVTEATAREIREWKVSHPRMMITSTVPSLHSWDINTGDMKIMHTREGE